MQLGLLERHFSGLMGQRLLSLVGLGSAFIAASALILSAQVAEAAPRSCETLFKASTKSSKPNTARTEVSKASNDESTTIGITETITSIYTGSQLYSVVLGESGKINKQGFLPGLYKRHVKSWNMLVPGEIMVDPQGAPLITQLSLGQTDKGSYVVTVVDGNVHLLTGNSDLKVPTSRIQFGTQENPLYEAGTKQKRFLPLNQKDPQVSVFQDRNLTEKGSQLVLVSMKFKSPQTVGDGITFAFELLPSTDPSKVTLNGQPTVLDYDYHETPQLANLVTGREKKFVFSKILFEQFQQTDLGFFGSHIDIVRDWLTNLANKFLGTMSAGLFLKTPDEAIAYNMTDGRIVNDVSFTKDFYAQNGVTISQRYLISRGRTEVVFKSRNGEYRLEGKLDRLGDGSAAIYAGLNGADVIFAKDGILHALINQPHNNETSHVELGAMRDLLARQPLGALPSSLIFQSFLPGGSEPIERGFVVLSGKMPNGEEFTSAIRLDLLLRKNLLKKDSFALLPFQLLPQDIARRLKAAEDGTWLFDAVTEKKASIAAYDQDYDASKPHVNVLESSADRLSYKFKKPNRVMPITEGITYAEFSETAGVENPSGIYTNIPPTKITGNEKEKFVGQLISRPNRAADETNPEKQFIFAKFRAQQKKSNEPTEHDYDVHGVPAESGNKFFLYAIDAGHKSGRAGYNLLLSVGDHNGAFQTFNLAGFGRTQWLGNIEYLKNATFLQGRRSDRDFVYLFVNFAAQSINDSQVKDVTTTVVFRINSAKPDEPMVVSKIDGLALTSKSIHEQVAFDESGVPNIVMTPAINQDAHQFAVFDLKKGVKEFPNRNPGQNRRRFNFADASAATIAQDDAYVGHADAWSIWAGDVRKKYPGLGRSADLAQFDSFIALGKQLDSMSQKNHPKERMILVVPESLRELVWDYILNKGFAGEKNWGPGGQPDSGGVDKFSHLNPKLTMNMIDKQKSTQEQYFANLESWSRNAESRPDERIFALARMDEIFASNGGRPEPSNSTSPFAINTVQAATGTDLTSVGTEKKTVLPSALYLLAAEKGIPLNEFRDLKAEPSASLLILATPEEMKTVEREFAPEVENNLLGHYKIQEIKDPDEGSMATSLAEIFQNKDVMSMGYKFSAAEIKQRAKLDSEQSFHVVLDYAISRFASLLGQKNHSRFESFMRFRSAFAQAILSDKEVRRTRLVNKYFIERVITQVFDIPMNLATLAQDDPVTIASRADAVMELQKAGYSGPFDFMQQVLDTVLSQTRADAGKAIPSSHILYGESGSGKTALFLALTRMLKLKLYDFDNESNNSDANAIIINAGKLKEKAGADRDGDMDVDQALARLNKLLATPNGYRSWILFDDVHAAGDAVKSKILNWQRGIFEAQGGMYTVATDKGTVRRPVRNLNIFMTLNPTSEQDQIARYAKDKAKPTTEEILLATMSSSDFKVEQSFLRRWGRISKLDYMPAGAKAPELVKSISKASNGLLNTLSRVVLVDPKVIQSLVANNETVDARTFLSFSTSALVEVASLERNNGAVVLIVPAKSSRLAAQGGGSIAADATAAEKITNWVLQNTRAMSLDTNIEGNLAFTKLVVEAFRMPIYESLAMALQENPRLAGSPTDQRNILAPVLAAISDHLSEHAYISLSDLGVNASEFGFKTPSERELFRAAMANMANPKAKPLYPVTFKLLDSVVTTWNDIHETSTQTGTLTRSQVVASLVTKNRAILRARLAEIMQVEDLDSLPDPSRWIVKLSSENPPNPKLVGRALVESLLEFLPQIFDKNLADNRTSDAAQLSVYSAARLYLYSIDRAMTQLQWVKPSQFLMKSLQLITEDQVLSQKQGVQNFLFNDPQRLIKPTIPDFTFQIIANSPSLADIPKESRVREREQFEKDLDRLLTPTGNR